MDLRKPKRGTILFKAVVSASMLSSVIAAPVQAESQFTDVTKDHRFFDAITA